MDNAIDIILGLDASVLSPELRHKDVAINLTISSTNIANILAELSDKVYAPQFAVLRDAAVEAIKLIGAMVYLATPQVEEVAVVELALPEDPSASWDSTVQGYVGTNKSDPSVDKILAALDPKTRATAAAYLNIKSSSEVYTMQEDIRKMAGAYVPVTPSIIELDVAANKAVFEQAMKRPLSDYEVAICIAEQWRQS